MFGKLFQIFLKEYILGTSGVSCGVTCPCGRQNNSLINFEKFKFHSSFLCYSSNAMVFDLNTFVLRYPNMYVYFFLEIVQKTSKRSSNTF